MTVRQLIEKLEGIALIWDGDAEIRLTCAGLYIPASGTDTGLPVSFQIERVNSYTPPVKDKSAVVDIALRPWGRWE